MERGALQDPVCGMVVGSDAAGRLMHDGTELRFCSQDCVRAFLADPARFAANVRAGSSKER
jgi:Cu+-exporting ATPase